MSFNVCRRWRLHNLNTRVLTKSTRDCILVVNEWVSNGRCEQCAIHSKVHCRLVIFAGWSGRKKCLQFKIQRKKIVSTMDSKLLFDMERLFNPCTLGSTTDAGILLLPLLHNTAMLAFGAARIWRCSHFHLGPFDPFGSHVALLMLDFSLVFRLQFSCWTLIIRSVPPTHSSSLR